MKCTESRNRISKLLWEKAPVETDIELSVHLQECDSCALYYKNYQVGIKGLMDNKRTLPDPNLWSHIENHQSRLENNEIHIVNNERFVPEQSNMRTITRLAWSVTAGMAAILAGIWTGNYFALDSNLSTDKQLYQQEISLQSEDLSGLSDGLIDYYTYEKQQNDE